VLIYDLGGGTFDVTLVQYTPTHFQVLATDGDVQLGGIDWNERLAEHVIDEFKSRHNMDPHESAQTLQILRNDCDLAKIDLTEKPETRITCRHAGRAVTVNVTREHFEKLTADLLQRTADTMLLVIDQAKVKVDDLDAIVLVGGSTLMPQVPQMIERVTGRAPYRDLSPYTSVAQGAAIHAAILEAKYRGDQGDQGKKVRKMLASVKQENVNSHGVGVVVTNARSGKRRNHVMIPRNTRLPAEVSQEFRTNHPGQQRVSVQVLEGDAPDPDACSLLGKCTISSLPKDLPVGSPIEVTYAFDVSGRITVKACDKTGGNEAKIQIERRGRLNDEQVDTFTELASEYKVE
jgi:molecular chaperone DnaK